MDNRMTPQRALALLQCAAPDTAGLRTQHAVDAAVEQWKRTTLRQAYRAQARAHHPDLHPPDQAAECTARMAQVNAAHDYLQGQRLLLRRRAAPPVRVVLRHGYTGGPGSTGTATTATTATAYSQGNPWAWPGTGSGTTTS